MLLKDQIVFLKVCKSLFYDFEVHVQLTTYKVGNFVLMWIKEQLDLVHLNPQTPILFTLDKCANPPQQLSPKCNCQDQLRLLGEIMYLPFM